MLTEENPSDNAQNFPAVEHGGEQGSAPAVIHPNLPRMWVQPATSCQQSGENHTDCFHEPNYQEFAKVIRETKF